MTPLHLLSLAAGGTVYPHTLFPTLQMGRNSVPHTLFPLQNGGNLKVHSTLFSPIIEGEKVQTVKVYPYPSLSGMTNRTYKILRNVYISVIHGQLPYCVKCLITYIHTVKYTAACNHFQTSVFYMCYVCMFVLRDGHQCSSQ